MNSAPACIILEQLGARGVELGGGRGGDEEEGESRKQQPYQCWNGSAVGDVGLLDWEKRNYSSFHPTLAEEGIFFLLASSCSFKTSLDIGRDLFPNIKESMRKNT